MEQQPMSIHQTTLFVHPQQVAEDFYAQVWGCQPDDAEAAVAEIARQVSNTYDVTGSNLTKVLSEIATRHAKAAPRVYQVAEVA